MTHSIPEYLKLHTEDPPTFPDLQTAAEDELTNLSDALLQATGWSIQYLDEKDSATNQVAEQSDSSLSPPTKVPVLSHEQRPIGQFTIQQGKTKLTDAPSTSLPVAKQLVTAIGSLISTLEQTRETVWKQEAQLATGIPVSIRKDEEVHLAARLETILRCGAEAVGCQAAAAYLLDDDTRHLKLRSCWGLPQERLLDPPRLLQGATADLEALVGHAVILKDRSCMPDWLSPQSYQAAVCVPISSPSVPLGTLWVFSDEARTFDQQQSNIVELVAGRISAELEREVLLQQQINAHRQDQQWHHALAWQENRLPRNAPLLKDWHIAADTSQANHIGGDFYDWNIFSDNRFAVLVGDAAGSTIEAALTAATVQASLRAHMESLPETGQLLNQVNRLLWTGCTGDQFASLFYALIDPQTGKLQYSAVGDVAGILVQKSRVRWLTANPLALGTQETSEYETVVEPMQSGDTLVLFSEGFLAPHRQHGQQVIQDSLETLLRQLGNASAPEIVDALKQWGNTPDQYLSEEDQTVLAVRHDPRSA